MALFRLTVKATQTVNGVRLEKGMSVEVAHGTASTSSPLQTMDGKRKVAAAFMNKYGIDLEKACSLTPTRLDVKKLN